MVLNTSVFNEFKIIIRISSYLNWLLITTTIIIYNLNTSRSNNDIELGQISKVIAIMVSETSFKSIPKFWQQATYVSEMEMELDQCF